MRPTPGFMTLLVAAIVFAAPACDSTTRTSNVASPAQAAKDGEPSGTPSGTPGSPYWEPPPHTPVAAKPAPSGGCGTSKLAEGRTAARSDSRSKPKKGIEWEEPSFRTCVVRATDAAGEGIDTFSRNDYSRRQAFNADSSLFITNARNGAWYLYDAKTLKLLRPLEGPGGDAEPVWHPSDPNTLFYGFRDGGLQIKALDVKKGKSTVFIDLEGKLPWPKAARAWMKSEGSPSRDLRYWGFQVETASFEILGYAIWDAVDKKLVGTMPSASRPDHVSMSPSGRWFTVSGNEGTVAYSRDFKQKKLLNARSEHSDLAIGADGHDYYVSIDYTGEGYLFMVDIDTGKRTDLIRTYVNGSATALHVSGKAYDKPGWVLVSTYNDYGPSQWFMSTVFAMELAASPRVYQLAAHHSNVGDAYFAEPQASVNRDFTRVLFNSNWGVKGSNAVDAYLIKIPQGAFP